jgi:hypothetical protein
MHSGSLLAFPLAFPLSFPSPLPLLFLSGALSLFCGCSKTSDSPNQGTVTLVPSDGHPAVTPLPDPELNGGHTGRAPRRLSVAQLKESIAVTTQQQWSQLGALAASLGQADFALTVSESTEANLVFAKFLDDGAREVCLAAARADLGRPDAGARMLTPEVPTEVTDLTTLSDEVVERNLSALALRFWGSPFDGAERSRWVASFRTLAKRAIAIGKPEQAWGAICIAMMTDPRFFTY